MAGLQELTKRLRSVETAGQLAGAMKTVSAAKLSQVNQRLAGFAPYADECVRLLASFGGALASAFPSGNPNAPEVLVVFGAARSLCGSYNANFLPRLTELLGEYETKPILYVSGKTALHHLAERGFEAAKELDFGEIPEFDDCKRLFVELCELLESGKCSKVRILWMRSVNSLVQQPEVHTLFEASESDVIDDMTLLFPDRTTVIAGLAMKAELSVLYRTLLESSASLHAATLVAMRSACDNAEELTRELSTRISRKRQSIITASVIETSSDLGREE